MSEINIFIVPKDDPLERRSGAGEKVISYLQKRQITDGWYDEELGWFAAGAKSVELFPNLQFFADDYAFEYAVVYESDAGHFVPDAHSYGFGATCTDCGTELDEVLYEKVLNIQGEGENALDMANATIRCPSCKRLNPLKTLKARIQTSITKFYVNFCVVDEIVVNPEIMRDLARVVGCELIVIPEKA